MLDSERELPGDGRDQERGRSLDGETSGQSESHVDGNDDEEESIAQDGGIRSLAKRGRSLLLSRPTRINQEPVDTISSFTSKIVLWHFASASLRRVTWLVSVEEREPRLPPPLKLGFQALTDGASLCGLALLLLRSEYPKWSDAFICCRASRNRRLGSTACSQGRKGMVPLFEHHALPDIR